jgi:hypothetical protein
MMMMNDNDHGQDDNDDDSDDDSTHNRVNVHNLAQAANPLFQINRLDQNPRGLLPLVKPIDFKEGTQLQLQRRFFQTAPICIQ